MASLKLIICLSLILSANIWLPAVARHQQNRGNSGIEMLLAAGILAKLLNKKHHHHQSHPIPIPIPVPVHHGGHEVIHHGHHGHHDHHGYESNNYYDYAAYGGGGGQYYAAPSQYLPVYY